MHCVLPNLLLIVLSLMSLYKPLKAPKLLFYSSRKIAHNLVSILGHIPHSLVSSPGRNLNHSEFVSETVISPLSLQQGVGQPPGPFSSPRLNHCISHVSRLQATELTLVRNALRRCQVLLRIEAKSQRAARTKGQALTTAAEFTHKVRLTEFLQTVHVIFKRGKEEKCEKNCC